MHNKHLDKLTKLQKKQVERIQRVIIKKMTQRKWQIAGKLYYLDQRGGVFYFADVVQGTQMQHMCWDTNNKLIKVGNIIDGKFVYNTKYTIPIKV